MADINHYTLKPNSYDLRTKGQLKVPQTRLVDKSVEIKALLWNRVDKSMLKHRFYIHSFTRRALIKYILSSY